MWSTYFYVLCGIFVTSSLSTISENNISLVQRWKEASRLDTFQQTVKQFPFLIQNIKIKNLIDFIDLGICQFMQGDPGRYLIIDNEVYLYGGQKQYQRTKHFQKYLQKILKTFKVPDMYLLVHIYDALFPTLVKKEAIERCRSIPMFLFNKNLSEYVTSTKFLLPDNYITIDTWPQIVQEIKNVSLQYKWKEKIPKLFYRGACVATFKYDFSIIPQPITREIVLKYCQRCGYAVLSYQHPDLIDAKLTTKCTNNVSLQKYIIEKYGQSNLYGNFLQFTQQAKYRYLLYADGAANSWRRAASFLFSSSVLVMPFSQNVQWFYKYLIPNVNFLMVRNDLSDLIDKIKQLQKNQTKALQIVNNGNEIAQKHLTFEAMANFTIQQITKYAKVQNLVMNQQQKKDIKRGIDAQLILKIKVMRQQWEAFNQYVVFEKILNNFPQLKSNIEISRLIQMKDNNCNKSLAKFIILENNVYCQGEHCQSLVSKNINKMIKKVLQDHIIPDLYFLIAVDELSFQSSDLKLNISQACKNLPYFVLSKDRENQNQLNKFLFPQPQFSTWQDEINKFKSNIKTLDWNKKENKTYFGGIINDIFQLNQDSHRSIFAKSLTKIINSKNQYFQVNISKYFQQSKEAIFNINEKYKYLLMADGINTKNRKSKILAMFSKMIVLWRRSKKITWLDEFMIPGRHYVQIKEDLSNLKYTIQLLKENDHKIKQICDEAFILAQSELEGTLLHRYIIRLLKNYSTIQKLKLSPQQKKKFMNGASFDEILRVSKTSLDLFQTIFSLVVFLLLGYCICIRISKEYFQSGREELIKQELQQNRVFKQIKN